MSRKVMDVLALFAAARREVGVLEVAALLGLPKSTASRRLAEMAASGFLDRDEVTGRYRVSLRLAAVGELARQATSLQRLALPELERVALLTGETANLVVLSGGEAVNVEQVVSPRPLKHVGWVGRRLPLHATAAGKALLAGRSPAEVRRLVGARPRRHASATITQVADFLAELARVERRGYATAWAELEDDLAAVAAPVRDHAGATVAAVTISAPTSRAPRRLLAKLALPVLAAAGALSTALGHDTSPAVPE